MNIQHTIDKKNHYPRLLLAAGSSGSGKTLITCGLLKVFKNRGLTVTSFKCGPDYIDPMFHEQVLHTKSRNLDTFFTDEEMTRYLFEKNAEGSDISVIEGVMGYYDGLGGISDKASAYDVACVTDTPSVLIVDTKGMSLSVLAYVKGFLEYRGDSHIRGVILNRMSPMIYPQIKERIEEELGIHVYGYVPKMTDCVIESRHLGLVTPGEIEELDQKLEKLAETLEKTLEIEELLALAQGASIDMIKREHCNQKNVEEQEKHSHGDSENQKQESSKDLDLPEPGIPQNLAAVMNTTSAQKIRAQKPVIAVARDEAFCFLYEDNLQLLREIGAEIREFSPIHDQKIPEDADGLLLCGGYPELHAKALSENQTMLTDIRTKILNGLPCLAECGGFMYLHDSMEDMNRQPYPMVGAIHALAFRTEKLGRFGYIELTSNDSDSVVPEDSIGVPSNDLAKCEMPQEHCEKEQQTQIGVCEDAAQVIRAHEFHYFDSTDNGEAYTAKKPLRNRTWKCIHQTENMTAGFPHLYYYSNPEFALRFCEKCEEYQENRRTEK